MKLGEMMQCVGKIRFCSHNSMSLQQMIVEILTLIKELELTTLWYYLVIRKRKFSVCSMKL